mmetsp:Transcript_8311/g.14242  ORF Transcript_8311/g.14242 Transcript_8311/m.14242 type:complete len:352 (+) Transcript_8311:331-1386(+)|eukprot:CAMPEP_0196654720 /NCGR_PEP_ID=MMETSP1086-20130531/4444_1 /TAXON_ID=77921 /ORGANISM="Cyanoptyche  gloeocystis , Strain SAG4.97" /LENGTH=351 /DNA_ID=CAMNT_0041986641 /DNA_START=326 /DNA_END=1381 /DNA_ORIENTATION=-
MTSDSGLSFRDRLSGALWGMFVGDALAMPVHWYYRTDLIERDYGTVRDYVSPSKPHPDSIIWRSKYKVIDPKVDILGEQGKLYGRSEGVHYHQILKKGMSTLNLQVAKVLAKTIVEKQGYDRDMYLAAYIEYMLKTPNKDTYAEVYHREFFENYSLGKPPAQCAGPEGHDTASVGGLVTFLPLLLAYSAKPSLAIPLSLQHLRLSHRSANLEVVSASFAELLLRVVAGTDLRTAVETTAQEYGVPVCKLATMGDKEVVGRQYSPACYIQDSFPSVLHFAYKYAHDFEGALVANTNVGGDNSHRGACLGALVGAAVGLQGIPERWIKGLHDHDKLKLLIDSVVDFASSQGTS